MEAIAKVLNATCEHSGSNEFGALVFGSITLEAPTLMCFLQNIVAKRGDEKYGERHLVMESGLQISPYLDLEPDTADTGRPYREEVMGIAIARKRDRGTNLVRWDYFFLMLIESKKQPGAYERLGCFPYLGKWLREQEIPNLQTRKVTIV